MEENFEGETLVNLRMTINFSNFPQPNFMLQIDLEYIISILKWSVPGLMKDYRVWQ